eukprot:17540-Heterococcus_DN1.PRE.2
MLQSCIQWRQHVIRIDAHDDKTGILDSIIKRGEADAEPLTHTHRTSLVHVTNCTQQHRGCGSEALTTVVQSRSDTPVQRRVTSFELRALIGLYFSWTTVISMMAMTQCSQIS